MSDNKMMTASKEHQVLLEWFGEKLGAIVIRDLSPGAAFLGKKHIARLSSDLADSEEVLRLSWTGRWMSDGLFAVTDRRIVFLHKRLLRETFKVVSIPLDDVFATRLERRQGILDIRIELKNGAREEFWFTKEATNRETIWKLLEHLPQSLAVPSDTES